MEALYQAQRLSGAVAAGGAGRKVSARWLVNQDVEVAAPSILGGVPAHRLSGPDEDRAEAPMSCCGRAGGDRAAAGSP